ncbi:MAG: efflux transporter outer membrane subunit [Acidobacteria bacterium]|nr:efflux transporter outer membrane subunit [Acidobacteriota bacterium]
MKDGFGRPAVQRSIAISTLAFICTMAGCRVGPQYVRPATPLAPEFKEPLPANFNDSGWKKSRPADAQLKGDWWTLFNDDGLNALEVEVGPANQTLKQAEANFRTARAAIQFYRASKAPTVAAVPSIGVVRNSVNQPYFNRSLAINGTGDFTLPFDLNYEIDLWGRVRRSIAQATEEAQASAADLESVKLSLHAELAIDYFNLRSADAQRKLLDDTVLAYKNALQLTEDRYDGGAAPLSDVTQARTLLQTAQVQATDVDIQRADYEHAIAVLIGKAPSELSLPKAPVTVNKPALPAIPGMLPSDLLERRPDIAAEERRMAAANEQIGIAKTAFYPTLSLSAVAGFTGTSAINWFTWPSRFFAVGPGLSQTLFDHGRRRATSDIALAQYDSTVAEYRQTTLTAFQQVEDNLNALHRLEVEADQQRQATTAAQESLDLFNTRYEGGVDTYLQVITWQTALLQNERNDIDITRRRLEASVLLVKALGGGWNTTQLPQHP